MNVRFCIQMGEDAPSINAKDVEQKLSQGNDKRFSDEFATQAAYRKYRTKFKEWGRNCTKSEYWKAKPECLFCEQPYKLRFKALTQRRFRPGKPYCSFAHYWRGERREVMVILGVMGVVVSVGLISSVFSINLGESQRMLVAIGFIASMPFIFVIILLFLRKDELKTAQLDRKAGVYDW